MGTWAAMAPAVALAPRRDGTPLPGTSSGIGGRPHVALRQPLPRYARRAVSPNRVRPGEAGGFTIVRSARRGDKYPGARDEDDPPRVDDVRVDDGSIARLPRARRATGARLVAARRSPSPDRARSVRLRCLPPSDDAAGHLAPDDDDDAAKDGASTPESGDATPSKDAGSEAPSDAAADASADAADSDASSSTTARISEEEKPKKQTGEKTKKDDEEERARFEPATGGDAIPFVIKGAAGPAPDAGGAPDAAADKESDADTAVDAVVVDPPVDKELDRRSKVMAAAEANVPPSRRDPRAQSTEEAAAEEAEAAAAAARE